MKIRILPLVAVALITAGSLLSSCLNSDYEEIELPSVSSIKSFSLGTLYQTLYKGSSTGQDTIDTISFAKYPFIIDQLNRKIYNVDSLPKGVDISKALVNISSDTEIVYYVNKNNKDTLWTEGDTLDLTNGLTLKVLTYSPTYNEFRFGEPYHVTVNVHNFNPDSLVWKHFDSPAFAANLSEQKAVYANNYLYVFGKDNAGTKAYRINAQKGNINGGWENVNLVSSSDINVHSALAYKNNVYYVADGKLYNLSDNTQSGSETGLSSLISVSNGYMLAYRNSDQTFIALDSNGTKNADAGTLEGNDNLSGRISAVSYQADHNSDLWRTVIMSNNAGVATTDTTANVFSYISSENNWIKNTPNNPATCPDLDNITMVRYDGKLYAFGGKKGSDTGAFESFYYSDNNGFDWRTESNEYMTFETNDNGDNVLAGYYNDKPYSCIVETDSEGKESFIWFIWYNGKISRCHLNKYAPKN